MKLSIIVPVYNVGHLLDKCLESLFLAKLKEADFEIILIDDASPSADVEATIIEKYLSLHNNLKYLHHEKNKGLSAARNTGLMFANGKYVWFVDSDDSINQEYLPELLKVADGRCVDVLCFGFNMIDEESDDKTENIIRSIDYERIYRGDDFLLEVPMHVMAWSALFRRDFLRNNNLSFCEGILHEDQEFTPRAYLLAERISYVGWPIYNYLQRKGSIMKSVNPKKIEDLITICDRLSDFAQNYTLHDSQIRCFFMNRVSFLYSQALRNMAICGYRHHDNKKFFPLSINKCLTRKEKMQYRLINFNVRLYVIIKKIAMFAHFGK